MRIIVAQSVAGESHALEGHVLSLCAALASANHEVQRLDLPAIGKPEYGLSSLASHRLMKIAGLADALICLDPVSAILQHPRKIVWLLEKGVLGRREDRGGNPRPNSSVYRANILEAAIKEAQHLFAPSSFAKRMLEDCGLGSLNLLRPDISEGGATMRRPGSELLLLGTLEEGRRPELLIDGLKHLSEPTRARWVTPSAKAAVQASLRRRADLDGVGSRLSIDIRAIDAAERAYFLSNAAALIELEPAAFVIPQHVQTALKIGLPVIACNDGGAIAEIARKPQSLHIIEPTGNALAEAVLAIRDQAVQNSPASSRRAQANSNAKNWAPLLKALTI